MKIDHDVHLKHALQGVAHSIFYIFTIRSNRHYFKQNMNLVFAIGRHPSLGADSKCAVKSMNNNLMKIIASFVII